VSPSATFAETSDQRRDVPINPKRPKTEPKIYVTPMEPGSNIGSIPFRQSQCSYPAWHRALPTYLDDENLDEQFRVLRIADGACRSRRSDSDTAHQVAQTYHRKKKASVSD
jgi:hypothetical protein